MYIILSNSGTPAPAICWVCPTTTETLECLSSWSTHVNKESLRDNETQWSTQADWCPPNDNRSKKQILPRNFWSSRKAKNFWTTFSNHGFRRLCFPHIVTTILHDIIIVEKKLSWKFRNKEKVYFGNIRSLAAPAFGNEDNYYQFITKERAPQTHCQSLVKIHTVTDLQDTWPWLHCSHSGHFATLICSNDTEHGCCTILLAVPSLWNYNRESSE